MCCVLSLTAWDAIATSFEIAKFQQKDQVSTAHLLKALLGQNNGQVVEILLKLKAWPSFISKFVDMTSFYDVGSVTLPLQNGISQVI